MFADNHFNMDGYNIYWERMNIVLNCYSNSYWERQILIMDGTVHRWIGYNTIGREMNSTVCINQSTMGRYNMYIEGEREICWTMYWTVCRQSLLHEHIQYIKRANEYIMCWFLQIITAVWTDTHIILYWMRDVE